MYTIQKSLLLLTMSTLSWGGVDSHVENKGLTPLPDAFLQSYTTKKKKFFTMSTRANYKVSTLLEAKLERMKDSEKIKVVLYLQDSKESLADVLDREAESFEMQVDKNDISHYQQKNKILSISDINDAYTLRKSKIKLKKVEMFELHSKYIKKLMQKYNLKKSVNLKKALKNGSGIISLELSKKEINDFITENDAMIKAIALPYNIQKSSNNSALEAMSLTTWAHPYGAKGEGVNVYVNEFSTVDVDNLCPNEGFIANQTNYLPVPADLYTLSNRYTNMNGNESFSPTAHARKVTTMLRLSAPSAHLYCQNALLDSQASYVDPFPSFYYFAGWFPSITPDFDIESYSWNAYQNFSTTHNFTQYRYYNALDQAFDQRVYEDDTAIFVSASNNNNGNSDALVLAPAKGLNVITVGNYDDHFNTPPYTIAPSSAYVNPIGGYSKPEISAPGTNVSEVFMSQGSATGTSFSTPFAAGFAADALSGHPFLKNSAALVKAFMIASATDKIYSDTNVNTVDKNKSGEGGIEYKNALYNTLTYSAYHKNGTREEAFPLYITDKWHCHRSWKFNLTQNKKANIALSWQSRGVYPLQNQVGEMDLNLYIQRPDGSFDLSISSDSPLNPYEVVRMTPTQTGEHTAFICLMRDEDSVTRNDFALVVTQGQ